jgi:two-component system OmpR family response regulator
VLTLYTTPVIDLVPARLHRWTFVAVARGEAAAPYRPVSSVTHSPGAPGASVLIIEDDEAIAAEIAAELAAAGFVVEHAGNGPEGLERARRGSYSVITLDRLLPGLDGLTLLETLRREGVRTPTLLLSALGDVDERVRGLRAGGDDYLTKPFVPLELSARVEALARRAHDQRATRLQVGDLVLDLIDRTATRAGRPLDLAPREMRLLEYLMHHAGQAVTRAMLFEEVWRYRFDPGTNLVDVHLGRLRRKVDGPGDAPLIHTVRRIGFMLAEVPDEV